MNLKVDIDKLVWAIVKVIGRRAGQTLLNDIADLRGAFGLTPAAKPPETPEDQATRLVVIGLTDGFARTVDTALSLTGIADKAEAEAMVRAVLPATLDLTPTAFDRPAEHPALVALRPGLEKTLAVCGVADAELARYQSALTTNFVIAIDDEQRRHRELYDRLDAYFRPTVAADAAGRARNWDRYWNLLIADVRRPILNFDPGDDNAVALEQVYVPLRCWVVEREETKDKTTRERRVVTWLRPAIDAWLVKADPHDPFRLISGEMGCGKSSFCKMLAADLAQKKHPVLVIPLHRIRHLSDDVKRCVQEFAEADDRLGHDPLARDALGDYGPGTGGRPLLLIFDGLDELSTGGGVVEAATSRFVATVCDVVRAANPESSAARVLALFAGRPLAALEVHGFAAPGQRLHVLRYRYDPDSDASPDDVASDASEPAAPRGTRSHRPPTARLVVPGLSAHRD